ncbi:hypothetical protein T191209_072 [Synechococcus phage S-CAM22]|uniref:Uncharacterized protein n=1 Tax=Synechococcus phage S-CAM22 TaxID=1883365 RepID=A0A1D8KR39_9CAUD|nr:hypothetical protein BOW88_gp159 [Synechococcus phage S-CAM22]YP_010088733.1 hypothetical protein KNT15_gp159 [Synechococcus phage S-CAM22]AOV60904.1 hypothetical protein C350210_072 [Synechococcus phage S-CAM22]AOV61118.1 hypothetical protein N440310_072 [Synechococcus phage S-CAM22]AOV61332.1 hypothetical protein T191209_072 [Synechococcus phage S-CAM22]
MSEELIEAASAEQIGQVITNINECLLALGKRLQEVEKYVSELPTPAKTYYKPEGYEDYLNLKENFDEIYRRIRELENGV